MIKHRIIRYASVQKQSPTISLYACYAKTGKGGDAFCLSEKGRRETIQYPFQQFSKIITTHLTPCQQTAELSGLPIEYTNILGQILHDMSSITNPELRKTDDIEESVLREMRKNFISQLWDDQLLISQKDICAQCESLHKLIMQQSQNTLFIAQGIVIKVYDLYCKTNGFTCPKEQGILLAECEKSFYGPLEGSEILA